jgi:hypothetical protein
MDVPDDQSFTVDCEAPTVTCPECLAAAGQRVARHKYLLPLRR